MPARPGAVSVTNPAPHIAGAVVGRGFGEYRRVTTAHAATAGCGIDELAETSLMVLELLLLVTIWVLGLTAVHLVKPSTSSAA